MGDISVKERLPFDLAWITALACTGLAAVYVVQTGLGVDAHAYWLAGRAEDPYAMPPMQRDSYHYSPAFTQVITPLAQLPWPVFCALIITANAGAFWWLLRPLPHRWFVPIWLMTLPEIVSGNVFWLLALVVAVGLRRPEAWVLVAATKLTPTLGPVWFLARREWRALVASVATIAVVGGLSYAMDPNQWRTWITFLLDNASAGAEPMGSGVLPPLVYRLPVAVAICVWAGVTDRPVLVPVAMVIATPVLHVGAFTMLCAIPRLLDPPGRLVSARKHSRAE